MYKLNPLQEGLGWAIDGLPERPLPENYQGLPMGRALWNEKWRNSLREDLMGHFTSLYWAKAEEEGEKLQGLLRWAEEKDLRLPTFWFTSRREAKESRPDASREEIDLAIFRASDSLEWRLTEKSRRNGENYQSIDAVRLRLVLRELDK
jgi:hypothetical protein